jgi:hypothetical protein
MITHPLEQTWIALCCLAIIGALALGVGLGSHLVLRHVVQRAPLLVWGDSRVSSDYSTRPPQTPAASS